jgi:starch-binding outer membrane protein, SusD/RagB family
MKKFNMKVSVLTAAIFLTCCDLDVEDPSALSPENALNDLKGYTNLANSVHRRTAEFSYYGQQMMIAPEILADNVELIQNTGRYTLDYVNGVGTLVNVWSPAAGAQFNSLYVAINECNWIISTIDKNLPGETEANRGLIKGEAYFHRALRYFDLHRIYSYEPGKEVGGFNEGLILRTEPTESAGDADLKPRSTNVEGYELIESDLLNAINLLSPPASTTSYPYRANKQAAHALLAKVYLYWGKNAEAAQQADLALAYANGALTTAGTWVNSWAATPHPESFFEVELRTTDWNSVDGANNSLHSLTQNAISGAQYIVAASDELIAAHPAGDVRLGVYVRNAGTLNEYQCRKWRGEKGTFLENIPVIRRSDIILIGAEAKAKSGDATGALALLNLLRTNRGLTPVTLAGQALLDEIILQRRLELAFEGNRWFDLKRLGLNIPKPAVSGAATVPYTDFRILQQIPITEITLNPNLVQNPNY